MINRLFEQIDRLDLEALVTNAASERRDLEFKRDLPSIAPDDIKEFLADVTSLANAQGGDLIYGIEAVDGVATALVGLTVASQDDELLRLENILRDTIDPRLGGVRMDWIPIDSSRGAIVIRVPASLAAPHRVRYRKSGLFYGRNSRGKYEMDAHELRTAFTQSEQLPQRIRLFHADAVAAIGGQDMPFSLDSDPAAVVSTTPLGYFREARDLDVTAEVALAPIDVSGAMNWRTTLDGVLMHTPIRDGNSVRSYALTHRGGRTDAAWIIGGVREVQGEERRLVWPAKYEKGLLDAARSTTSRLGAFGIEGPWVIQGTITGVRGFQMILGDGFPTDAAYRDSAFLGEIVVDQANEESLLPIMQAFWRLFSLERPKGRPV